MFIAIYAKDPFLPRGELQDSGRVVNSGQFYSKESALEFLFVHNQNNPLDFWHPQIFDTETGEYEHIDMRKVIFS